MKKINKPSSRAWQIVINSSLLVGGVFMASTLLPGLHVANGPHTTWHLPKLPISITARPKETPPKAAATDQQAGVQPAHTAPATPAASTSQSSADTHIADDKRVGDTIIAHDGTTYPIVTYKALALPNDPYANQWWVAPNGMDAAWNMTPGATQTKIAVIDTGFALKHEDLINRWATNSAETGSTTMESPNTPNCTSRGLALNKSCNGIDDDNNGFIDDSQGWDFTAQDNSPQAGETNPDGTSTTHGTTTAGVIAAEYNNGRGTAGVNRYSKILPLQALDDDGHGDTYTVGQAIYYAADQSADVISISLGAASTDAYLRNAIDYAIGKGSIVVASSGNDGCDCISYPANYPEVVAVGASTPSGARASFSNYGANLDLLAPGQAMIAPYWTKLNDTNAYASNLAGTSYSAPFVSGLLALGRSYQPTASWDEILGAMIENSDRRTLTAAAPRANDIGFGYAKADSMLGRMVTPASFDSKSVYDQLMLGSQRSYDCQAGALPSTAIYELWKAPTQRFTSSNYQLALYAKDGYSTRLAQYACIGLPGDTTTMSRSVNLGAEITNSSGTH